ncbi:MAG: peptidoglycan-binding protein, partial [Pyrinomonadaceae bacterium]|nr:peptidoglycan-binding protein [Pyrinomonadaceae bacterium]
NNLEVDGIVGSKTRAALDRVTTTVPTARLQRGANGEQVKQLQDALVKLGYMTKDQINGGGYGKFGPRTDAALRRFQSDKGLVSDGIYGPKTQNALRTALGGTTSTNPTNPTNPTTPVNPTNPTATTASAAKINDILKGTNLAGKGELISQLAQKYNVPAELALAMFRMEAGFATNGSLAQRNNNPGNIRFNNQEGATRGAGGFAKWDSMDKGIEAYFKLLDRGYRSFIDNKDWSGLVNKYAPPVENDSRAYTRNIVNWMEDYRNKIS